MKFDCGLTPEERFANLTRWHRWFAWRPVRVKSGECYWLEWVERKGTLPYYDGCLGWVYRAVTK